MHIKIGEGIEQVGFGLSESEVEEILGKPSKVDVGSDESRKLHFNEHMLVCSFERENECRLGWIEVFHPRAKLLNRTMITQSESDALNLLRKHLGAAPEYTDYGSFESYFFEEVCLELQTQFDHVTNVNFGVFYNADDKPEWPAT